MSGSRVLASLPELTPIISQRGEGGSVTIWVQRYGCHVGQPTALDPSYDKRRSTSNHGYTGTELALEHSIRLPVGVEYDDAGFVHGSEARSGRER